MNPAATRPSGIAVGLKAVVILAAVGWVYWPALHGGWLWDDSEEITWNGVLRDPAGWWKIWVSPAGADYFPLKTTLQWLLWHAGGAHPAVYHLTSMGLHALSGLLFWRLLDKLGVRLAWLGGLLFVVHPLAVESVAWISELKNTLSLPFLLLATLAYLEFDNREPKVAGRDGSQAPRPTPSYGLAVFCFALAMLSKTSVVMFPCVIFLYAWSKRGRISREDVADSLPFFFVAALLGGVTYWFQTHRAMDEWTLPVAGGLGSHLVSAGLAIAFYLGKSVFPVGLLPIYPQWSLHPHSLWQWLPWPILAALIGWFWVRRSGWGTPALLGLGFFILNLVPVLGFLPMAYLHIAWVADHFAYISLLGIVGLGVAGAGALASRLSADPSGELSPYAYAIAAFVAGTFAWESRSYAGWFRNEETLWTSAVRRDPSVWMAHNSLGNVILKRPGRLDDAIAQYREAIRLKPDSAEANNNLGLALLHTGDLADRLPEALDYLERAVRLNPGNAGGHENLANALYTAGRLPEAIRQYEMALQLRPDFAEARANLEMAQRALTGR
jgi:protein O-mannosyl-transferase